ncbi:MAG TPA: hypothetical protein DIW47_14160 [Bacteroidetes bacterium]|nr:hypothetical protein [Bacteroidota bacterium]
MKQAKYSLGVLLLSMAVIFIIRVVIADSANSLTWDVFGYYLYLPAYFIYDDPTLQNMDWVNHIIETYHSTGTLYQAVQVESGNWVMRYPGGLAVLNLPAFLVADILAEPLGYVRDGFSKPYQFAWVFGSMLYAFLGLIFSRKLLLKYFSDSWTAGILVLLVFGTNYLEIATYANPLSHNFLFALYAVALYKISGWSEKIPAGSALFVGILIGLITMCRPNEGLFILVPLLWKSAPWSTTRPYLAFLKANLKALLSAALGLLLGGLPQLLYWKYASGQWFYYSYQDNGVGFDFFAPHTWEFLFSYRKGWFVYTPLMFLATIGFIRLYHVNRQLFIPFFTFFLISLYIVSSWTVWWYGGGSYSSRSMASAYLIMAFPLGYVLMWLKERGSLVWISTLVIVVLMTILNLFQFWQFKAKIIDGERMTGAYYWQIFGKTSIPKGAEKLLLVERQAVAHERMPDDTSELSRSVLFEEWLGTSSGQENQVKLNWPDGSREAVCQLDESHSFTRAFEMGYEEITSKEYAWLRVSAEIYIPDSVNAEPPMLVTHFMYKERQYKYTTTEYLGPTLKRGEWQRISMDYMTPEVRNKADKVKIYLWYRGKDPIYARNLEVIKYEPKTAP